MVNYGVIEEKMCDSCMGEYITYGIGAYTTQAHELITIVSEVFPPSAHSCTCCEQEDRSNPATTTQKYHPFIDL